MQTLAEKIIHEASKHLGCYEEKTRKNRSSCVDYFSTFNGEEPKNEAWCAKFVSTILNTSFPYFLKLPPFSYTASTLQMLDNAKKKGIRVDNIPSVGAVFFTKRIGGGHVGFVKSLISKIDNGRVQITDFETIEGNSYDSDRQLDGVLVGHRSLKSNQYQFMHFEEVSKLKIPTSKETLETAGLVLLIVGLYNTTKLFKKKKGKK